MHSLQRIIITGTQMQAYLSKTCIQYNNWKSTRSLDSFHARVKFYILPIWRSQSRALNTIFTVYIKSTEDYAKRVCHTKTNVTTMVMTPTWKTMQSKGFRRKEWCEQFMRANIKAHAIIRGHAQGLLVLYTLTSAYQNSFFFCLNRIKEVIFLEGYNY